MRRALALAAVALAAFVLAAPATSATPTEQKLQRQVRVLQRQVKTLQKQVHVLQAQMKTANKRLACVSKAASITSYGVPSSNEGYLYQRPTATPSQFPTTALDFTLQGDKADALVAVVDPKCVTSTAATASHVARRAQHHVVLVRLNRNW